jgi:hypothetical protein
LTNERFCGLIEGHHVASFVDGDEGDISRSRTITTNGSDCPRDIPGGWNSPNEGRGLGILLMKNIGELLDPPGLAQGVTSTI